MGKKQTGPRRAASARRLAGHREVERNPRLALRCGERYGISRADGIRRLGGTLCRKGKRSVRLKANARSIQWRKVRRIVLEILLHFSACELPNRAQRQTNNANSCAKCIAFGVLIFQQVPCTRLERCSAYRHTSAAHRLPALA